MLPAISDFLKDTLGESLKKPLQPAGLFAAAIFVFLNLVFVMPDLKSTSPLVQAIDQLDAVWLAVLATVITLILAYVLVSFSGSILRIMSGETWNSSPLIGRLATNVQKFRLSSLERQIADYDKKIQPLDKKIKSLQDQLDAAAGAERKSIQGQIEEAKSEREVEEVPKLQLQWEKEVNFPEEPSYLAPTNLGNILNATSGYIWSRYRIDMTALWPQLETIVADKGALPGRIDNAKAAMDFLLNLSFILAAFGLEYLIVKVGLKQDGGLACLVYWLLAYAAYRAALGKARAWGDAVQMAFDLHRDALRQALNVRKFTSRADEKDVWEKVSGWLLWGEKADEVFEGEPTAPDVAIESSANVKVAHVERITTINRDKRTSQTDRGHTAAIIEKYVDYWLTINHAAAGQTTETDNGAASGVFVSVTDQRAPLIDSVPTGQLLGTALDALVPVIQPMDSAHLLVQLVWPINQVPPNGALLLHYQLPIYQVFAMTSSENLEVAIATQNRTGKIKFDYTFTITNEGQALENAFLEVFHNNLAPADNPLFAVLITQAGEQAVKSRPLTSPARYQWRLGNLDHKVTVTLKYGA